MLVRKEEIVDIYQHPAKIALPTAGVKLVYGDLDANAMKFLHFLVREGVLSISKANYEKLAQIYIKPVESLTQADLETFSDIISQARVVTPSPKITLIGDDLADRGMNDYYMLKIYEKLSNAKIDFEVLCSNHGAQFLRQYANGLDNENLTIYRNEHHAFGESLHNLQTLIWKGLVSMNEMDNIMTTHYLPRLKLLSYDHLVNDNSEIINLYTHAPADVTRLKNLAECIFIEFKDETTKDLIDTISLINEKFQEMMNHEELNKHVMNAICKIKPIEVLLNDRYSHMEEYAKSDTNYQNYSRPYVTINIYGHVGSKPMPESIKRIWAYINTDGPLGKSNELNQEKYSVLTTEKQYLDTRFLKSSLSMFSQNTNFTSAISTIEEEKNNSFEMKK